MSDSAQNVNAQPTYQTSEYADSKPETKRNGRKRTAKAAAKPSQPRKPRKKKETPAEASAIPATPTSSATQGDGQGDGQQHAVPPCRLLSQFKDEVVTWLVPDYIGRGFLNVAVGKNDVGKSALLAYAISRASFTILFPCAEEGVGLKLVKRLRWYGVDMDKVAVPEGGEWQLPACKSRLIKLVEHFKADLVAWDNLNTYVQGGVAENDAGAVRPALEAAGAVGIATGAALLGNRHPGKGKDNIMRGSGEWLNVPRVVLHLTLDPGSEDQGTIRHYRDSFGMGKLERHYRIGKEDGEPGLFQLGDRLSDEERKVLIDDDEELVAISKRKQAREVIPAALADGRKPAKDMYDLADRLRINHKTWYRAGLDLGVRMYQEGYSSDERADWWELPGGDKER
jgi:hypothetical protein